VTNVYISNRQRHGPDEFNFAFLSFDSEDSVKAALAESTDSGVFFDKVSSYGVEFDP
jgi:hypothetical protein